MSDRQADLRSDGIFDADDTDAGQVGDDVVLVVPDWLTCH